MKLIHIKPKLVDYELFKPTKINLKPKPKIIPKSEPSKNNFSFYINCIGILILIIGVLILYDRLTNKQSIELEKQNTILNFHQYVQEKTQEKTQEIK